MTEGTHRRFAIGPCLGRGGFGEVYRATMHSPGGLSTEVVIKVLRPEVGANDDALRRLRDEGRVLGRLRHPVVVHVFDLVRLEGRVALVTEYVDGADLDRCWGGPDPIPARALCEALAHVADGLDVALRAAGPDGAPLQLVHRDLKPANIRIGRHGQTRLLDFGIARFEGLGREAATAANVLVGSLPYLAPEAFLAGGARPSGDVYALGCVLFEGLAGERLVPPGTANRMPHLASDPEAFARFIAGRLDAVRFPEGFRPLLERLLAADPDARPTAPQVRDALEQLAEGSPGLGLRAWCRAHAWPAPAELAGSLVGRELSERPLAVETPPAPPAPPAPEAGGPKIVRRAQPTVDFAPPPPPSAAPPPTAASPTVELEAEVPTAPPARPRVPLWVFGGAAFGCGAAAAAVLAIALAGLFLALSAR